MVGITVDVPNVGTGSGEQPLASTLNGDGSFKPDFAGSRDSGGDDFTFDPVRHVGTDKRNADGSYRRKRGRRAATGSDSGGTGTRRRSKSSVSDVEAIAFAIAITVGGISSAIKAPELNVSDDESKVLGSATANFMDQFDLKPDPKITALVGLFGAFGTVFGPKVAMMMERQRQEKQDKKERKANGIIDFPAFNPNAAS